jgi:hypothetical protein
LKIISVAQQPRLDEGWRMRSAMLDFSASWRYPVADEAEIGTG